MLPRRSDFSMSLSFPIPEWDEDNFSYPVAVFSGTNTGNVNPKKKNKNVRRKHEAEGTPGKVPPGNVETSPQPSKKRKREKTDNVSGEKGSNDLAEPKVGPKKKKKKGQKNIGDSDHALEVSSNQEKKTNATLLHTQTESVSKKKKKKKRKSKNKYKEFNLQQKAEQMAQTQTSKDPLGNKVSLEHDSGSIEDVSLLVQYSSLKEEVPSIMTTKDKKKKTNLLDGKYNSLPQESKKVKNNESLLVQDNSSKKEVQSSPKKKVKKKKKASLLDDNYYSVPQEISTLNRNEDVSSCHSNESQDITIIKEIVHHDSLDGKKKKKKKLRNNLGNCQILPLSNETPSCPNTSEFILNGDTKGKDKVKKKKKFKSKESVTENTKIEKGKDNSAGTKISGQIDNDNRQVGTAQKKKKLKNKENATSEVKDIISPKKTKMENLGNGGREVKTEDSEAEEIMFDGSEECSEEFNKDFSVLLSSLNFDQFKSAKKSKNKGNYGRNSAKNKQETSKISSGLDSVDEEWDCEGDGKTTGVKSSKRKRDSAETDFEDISGKLKKNKKVNISEATEKPLSPTKKTPKFNREKLARLLEEAASKKGRPSQSPQTEPDNSLKKKMEDRLMAARFRLVNEELYTKNSTEAVQLFRKDPEKFSVYHQGYQAQVRQWPVNPLDLIVTWLSKKPKEWVVADMGCGEATLAQQVPQSHVHSLDLVAANNWVTACDMAHTPLAAGSVDVVVFCLSLMGTNLKDFISEANRILREGGIMKIAEVESRCGDVKEFEKQLGKYGFHCTGRDISHQYFFLLEFKKNRKLKKTATLPDLHLKPCLYKKR